MKKKPASTNASPLGPALPWWRIRMVWLVIAGPAVVMVAGFVTLALAIGGQDAPLRAPDSAEHAMRHLSGPKSAPLASSGR